jgi:hypothetical protein
LNHPRATPIGFGGLGDWYGAVSADWPIRRGELSFALPIVYTWRRRVHVLAGQRVGIQEVDEGNGIVSLMQYDLSYIDSEQKTLQPLDNLVRHEVVAYVSGTACNPGVRAGQRKTWRRDRDSNPRYA